MRKTEIGSISHPRVFKMLIEACGNRFTATNLILGAKINNPYDLTKIRAIRNLRTIYRKEVKKTIRESLMQELSDIGQECEQ